MLTQQMYELNAYIQHCNLARVVGRNMLHIMSKKIVSKKVNPKRSWSFFTLSQITSSQIRSSQIMSSQIRLLKTRQNKGTVATSDERKATIQNQLS